MARVGDNVDERRLIVLLGNGRMVHTVRHQGTGLDRTQGKTHGKADALAGNGSLKENGFTVQRAVARHDNIRKILDLRIVTALVGHSGHLGEYLFTNVCNQRRNSTHGNTSGLFLILNRGSGLPHLTNTPRFFIISIT